jgi:integrase
MPKYLKDISHMVTQAEAQTLVNAATNERDKFLVSILYLTGARPEELSKKLFAKDFDLTPHPELLEQDEYFKVNLFNAKQGVRHGFKLGYRTLEIRKRAPFAVIVFYYAKNMQATETPLIAISSTRIRQIVYKLSNNQFCPYHFRHSRLTSLSRGGATKDELMYWKGCSDGRSVDSYLSGKPIGRRLELV